MATTGRFIVFEGGEGSGKSTQAKLLAQAIDADLTREPGGTKLAEEIRGLLLHADVLDLSPRAELLLMVAARAQHVAERITPTLSAGRHVVCDRFSGSTLAYQGYGRGLPLEDVVVACEIATEGVVPDLNILLDLSPELAAIRRTAVPDRIEAAGTDFHARVADGFRAIAAADPSRWAVVDGNGSVDEVSARVQKVVTRYLGVEW